jgi:uncharacterized membrane protein
VRLYCPYMIISVSPGETINYSIDIINNGSEIENVNISVAGMPRGWDYIIKSGGWYVKQLSILPGEEKNFYLTVEVPFQVNKGYYRFRVIAGDYDVLPLVVNVSEQGTYKTEFTSKQVNMEGHASSTFTFNTELKNSTAEKQLYSLRADVPRGWDVVFKPNYKQSTSVEIEPNTTVNMNVDINPPNIVKAGTYKIPLSAVTGTTSAILELEVVITGSYDMELTTPRGLLSTSVTAGDEKTLELIIRNTGSADLRDISLEASTPVNWEVLFEPQKINRLEAGKVARVMATVKVDKKAIAGDYATTINAETPEVSSKASFRISVKTPMLWGWVGIFIIIAALGTVYYLFRKYGRR